MISNDQKRVKIQDVVENQLPSFVREDFPLVSEFLKQYYLSQEYQGAPTDLLSNIDLYLNLDVLSKNDISETTLTSNVLPLDNTISVSADLIYSFPDKYGLIQIDDEIILYTSKGNNSFDGCIRGFSGVTSFTNKGELVFSESEVSSHSAGTQVKNLSGLFLDKFLTKIKKQISPGFENRELYNNSDNGERVNQSLFLKHTKDFYNSKGTENSFEILFRSLYNENVSVIIPSKNLFRPSDAQYSVTKDIVVESIQGNPLDLLNKTLYQDSYSNYGISNAYGSVTNAEKITVDQKDYYRLSVDFDYSKDITLEGSVYGDFSIHPKTKVITQVSSTSSSIDVDSTIGFPDSGNLVVSYGDGTTGIVTYTSKTYNQFLNIVGVSTLSNIEPEQEIRLDAFAYGYSGEDLITMRIGSVLSSLNLAENTYYYNDDDTAKIKSLGIEKSSPKTDCWIYNIQTKFDLQQVPTLVDQTDFTYRVSTHLVNNFRIGDSIILRTNLSETYNSVVTDILNQTTFTISGQGTINTSNRFFTVERKLKKPSLNASLLSEYQNTLKYTTDVQNVYAKFNEDVLVSSSSIPSASELNFYDRILLLTGPYAQGTTVFNFPNHGYYTGDKVFYEVNPNSLSFISGLASGSYIIQRIDQDRFKLATSLANIYASYRDTNENDRQSRFISVSSGSTNAGYFGRLIPLEFVNRSLDHQNILKEIKPPVNDGRVYPTEPGTTGILINGVEVLNYKSNDFIYHGKINSLQVVSEGENYDVINPPLINISDEVGSGATAKCSVSGSLQRIDLIDTGFDYTEIPTITISGGNGTGATAEVNTSLVTHSVNFYSDVASSYISTSANTIGFSTYHKFRNYERVIYKTDGQNGVSGLTTDSHYHVGLIDAVTLKLFETESDAISGINTVGLSSFGNGVHRLVAFNKKRIVSGVTVTNSGRNYENNEKIALPVGINTALDVINVQDHGYNSGDIISYTTTGTTVSGLTPSSTYIVTKVDDDNFKLSQIGLGQTARYFYYDTNQYVNLQSTGSGVHTFNYEPISVSIDGPTGVTTFSGSGQNFNAIAQPIFRGNIVSAQVTANGVGYGVTDIFNLDRQPVITLQSGSGARLLPIVSDGGIREVLIVSPGVGYNCPPDLNIVGSGRNAKLTPVIVNGQIERVVVNRSGTGYTNSTSVDVISAGSGAKLKAKIQSWNVNLFAKKYNNILNDADDGILYPSNKFGIKYTYMYSPRKLRMSIYGKDFENNIRYGNFDLSLNESNEEINSQYHSPIIGWAYDGNPIYGPFGFTRPSGGNIRLMKSGYTSSSSITDPNRPPFEEEFFIEDFIFTNDGDLDEHNGRFCVTPEFPQGTYAYFSTINVGSIENSGPFLNYKKPVFPYLIGNSFKSRPNEFNFNINNNQKDYRVDENGWFRNTKPYNLNESKAYYNYLTQPNKLKDSVVNLKAYKGSLDSVKIVSGGSEYKVGDAIIFEPANRVSIARVEKISGKDVNNVSTSSTTFYNVEITRNNPGEYIAFTEVPHSFIDGDNVYVSGLSTSTRGLQGNFVVGVSSEVYELTSGIGSDAVTGIVTYFNIRGNLNYPALRVDDILQIESEKVKVLSIDNLNSRVRVLRSQDGTLGVSHTATTTLTELTKKVTFTSIPENIPFNQNKKIYFNPEETLGIGTNSGVGIGVTLSFANPGAGITEIFIPTRSLYMPDHGLNTGERVVYSFNQGSSIAISTTGIGSTTLDNNSSLYVAKIDNNTIGLSTVKVGLGSTGTFVGIASTTSGLGLLYFVGVGTGVYHSLETIRDSVTSEVSKNSVTVSLAATHGLSIGDRFDLTVKPVTTFTVVAKYNDYNRRIVFNPKTFISGDVDIAKDTIYIQNHDYINGDKIIHSSSSPCGGLVNEKIYYVIRYSADKIRLSETHIGATQTNKEFVDITSASFGTISAINPKITGYKNSKIRFDTSDSSLSYTSGITYSAFKLNFYTDSSFTTIFETSRNSSTFEVNRVGNIGFSGSYVDLEISDFLPEELYYEFIPVHNAPLVKNQIVVDEEVFNFNKIVVKNSEYQGNHTISGIGATTFNFNLNYYPEKSSYNTQEASIEYKTSSRTSSGGIAEINIVDPGFGYDYLPGVSTIRSLNGSSAILESQSRNIGSISSYTIENIGFDYPSDNTLRPVCNLPEILEIEPLSSFEEIGISSAGRNYLTAPNLAVIDGFTNRVVRDVDLRYRLGDNRVTILTNTYGIYNTTPTIIPINNTNGVGISSLQYNSSNQNVTVYLNSGFSDSFPFSVGDRVLIENVSVGVATTGYGYNSSNYEYSLFTLTGVYPGLGGNVGVVTYSLSGHLPTGRTPGNYDNVNSSGRIIAEKDFPIFRVSLRKNNFIIGETVKSSSNEGIVESWNNDIDILKVSTRKDFSIGEVVVGQTSRTQGLVSRKYDFNADFSISASSIVKKGWESQAGFLNSNTERMSDNFYYQKFSYSLKSRVPLQTWDDPVSSLNHTAGYLKFSDLDIESDSTLLPIFGDRYNNLGSTEIIVDLYKENDLDCYSSYDYATENSLNLNSRQASDEIYFRNSILTDYFESIGNRVLKIDDISGEFNSNERVIRYSVVDRFSLDSTYKKYFLLAQDAVFYDERQFSIVSLLQDGSQLYINQYGRVESQLDLGYYDAIVFGSEGNLRFYPTKYQSNNYNVTNVSFDINQVIGVGTTAFGDVVKVSTSNTSVSVGTTTTIVSIADTYRSSKVLVQIKASNDQYQVNEINLLHNGSDVYTLEYGQINSETSTTSSGLGTYNAYILGNNVVLDFIPSVSVASTVSSIIVSIANTSLTGIGTQDLSFGTSNLSTLESNYVSISSSPTPTNNIVASYSDENSGAYFIMSIEDTTNNNYEMLELIVVNDSTNTYLTQYGEVISSSGIGTFGSALVGNDVQIYFTPLPNIDVQVRSFELDLRISSTNGPSTEQEVIDLESGEIRSNYGYYFGTLTDVKREFELTHSNREIFERLFNANSSEVVNITDDTITIPEHFFVTGEEVVYAWPGAGTTASIGIGTTTFAGIGQTDKLPSSVFVIKVDDTKIKLARSAEDALNGTPISVDLLSVGVGTGHTITSVNQNSKCLVLIDNVIQSPIVSTATTTLLSSYLELSSFILEFDNVGSFFGNDLIKIDNEIMKIKTVGFGSTNRVLVDRPWMGTGISTHSSGSLVTKIEGQYNIIDNTIHFVSAPYGNIPIGSTTNAPDERDWIGITTSSKFQGRVFLRSGQPNTSSETYSKNYIFDDISDQFDATTKDFALKVNNQDITGISDNNAIVLINSIFQSPSAPLVVRPDYDLEESSGITSIRFTGTSSSVSYDPNNSSIPVGGIIVSVASTEGFGYQPLVAAGGTAVVSIAGTISSISIGNSGSGYRVGIQTIVNVGVYTSSTGIPNIEFIGTASISNGNIVSVAITNPGTGYTSTNPPLVVFDSPLNYSNIPLVYSSSSSGVGTEATVDIVVGQGSSVIDFELKYTGYKYQVGDVLTFAAGGTSGIPTDTTKPFREFQITVDTIERDRFSGWHLGELQVFDSIESLFDGQRRVFPLSKDGNPISIRVSPGSNIDIQSTLLVFLNDVLQVPGEGYTYQGGSVISFPESPKGPSLESGDPTSSDRCTIIFYKGSGDIDVIFRDILETVKVGDTLTINDDNFLCSNMIQQDERIVTEILSSDSVETNTYFGPGISGNPDCYRTVDWCKQKNDLVIDGNIISKSRIYYEPIINPVSYLIQPVGVGSTIVYVDSIRPFFNQNNENNILQNSITFISQDQPLGAAATATVSVAGTVSSINITNGGSGYISAPNVSVQVGFGTTQPATAVASVSAGVVTSISVVIPGIGYTSTQPPVVLIEPPTVSVETNDVSQYFGDYGKVVGFGFTTSSGISTITFDLWIENDSFVRDSTLVGTAITISGISTGDYILINDSNIGLSNTSITSLRNDSSSIGIGTQFVSNVYQVIGSTEIQKYVTGIGTTYVNRVEVNVSGMGTNTLDSFDSSTRDYIYSGGITTSTHFGSYSWGRIHLNSRTGLGSFGFYGNNGVSGIVTSAIVRRTNPLKYNGYL